MRHNQRDAETQKTSEKGEWEGGEGEGGRKGGGRRGEYSGSGKGEGERVEMEGKHTDAANVSFILFAPIYRQERENRRVEAKFLLWHVDVLQKIFKKQTYSHKKHQLIYFPTMCMKFWRKIYTISPRTFVKFK
jgi:hypothetical protein